MVHSRKIGFASAKQRLLTALDQGNFVHEVRESGKNRLAEGSVTANEVRAVVLKAKGAHYLEEPDERAGCDNLVHKLQNLVVGERRWYLKWHFSANVTFISVQHYEVAKKKH